MNDQQMPPTKKPGIFIFLGAIAAILIVLFVAGLLPRLQNKTELNKAHAETVDAIPTVRTIIAKPAEHTESLTLPGNIGAIQYTTIYARVDGYLTDRLVDIGDTVKKGQLLARIDTPTVDQELNQSKADLQKAVADVTTAQSNLKESIASDEKAKAEIEKTKANVAYAQITAKRWQDLCAKGAVSEQSRDEKVRLLGSTSAELEAALASERAAKAAVAACRSELEAAKANQRAKKADVLRLTAKQGFKNVTAPFDGVITLRKVDPGALITSGSGNSNLELFQMAKIDNLRVYVSAPQRVSRYLKDGLKAEVIVPEYPDRKFTGVVSNVSGALDPNTRTRQTEIRVANKDHTLLPGMYAEIRMSGVREAPWIRVSGTCIVTRSDGQFVVVNRNGKAHYQPVSIGRDFGHEVEIRTGLNGSEEVVVSPNDDLREGDPIRSEPSLNQT